MNRRRRVAAALLVAAIALVSPLGAAGPAGAAELQDSGWWWRANPGQGSLTPTGLPQRGLPSGAPETPPPSDVPEDGLAVERAPDGASAVAAVRFDAGEDALTAVLELKAASAQGVPELLACPSSSVWSGAHGGRWDSRPQAACDATDGGASVAGQEGEEGAWTFDVGPLVDEGGILDVLIVPAPPEAGAAVPFRIVFEPVTGASLSTPVGSGGDFSFDGGGFASGGGTAFDAGDAGGAGDFGSGAGDFGSGAGAFDIPPALTPSDISGPTGGDQAAAPAVGGAGPDGALAGNVPLVPDDGEATAAAVAVIIVGAAVMYAAVRRPTPTLESLVPLRVVRPKAQEAPARVAGLGRFARPRTKAPIRLG